MPGDEGSVKTCPQIICKQNPSKTAIASELSSGDATHPQPSEAGPAPQAPPTRCPRASHTLAFDYFGLDHEALRL